jgi:hypothetical protein
MSKAGKLAALWAGILAGPIGWGVDEVVGYSGAAHECSTGRMTLLHGLSIGALALCGMGFFLALGFYSANPEGTAVEQRQKAMAKAGMILSIAFAVVVIATAIPKWMLDPCS